MSRSMLSTIVVGLGLSFATVTFTEEISLFNGKDLEGWTLDTGVERDGEKIEKEDVFLVQDGVLICRGGLSIGTLRHEGVFAADYALSLEWRWGPNIASGTDIVINSSEQQDEIGRRKEIHVSLTVDEAGGIVYRGAPSRYDTKRDRQTDQELEREMGEWNQLQIICREQMITVVVNGQPVNQVTDAPHSTGAIGLGVAPVPIFYRNVKLTRPLGPEYVRAEQAAKPLAAAWAKIEVRKKAEQLKREEARLAEEQQEERRKARLVAERNSVVQSLRDAVASDKGLEVAAKLNAQALPYPRDARDLKFNAIFGMIDFKSGSSLQALAAFYLREMAKRGWVENQSEATMEEDSIELIFEAAGGEFELELDQSSDYVDVSIDTDGVDFNGTNDPASLAALAIPQPRKALLLQQEISIPADAQRLSFDDDSCMFYSTMKLEQAFAHFGDLIRQKGYQESRRPILSDSRNYTEFQRGGVELSVNIFTDPVGTRIILEYDDGKQDPVLPPLPEVELAKTESSNAEDATTSDASGAGSVGAGNIGASNIGAGATGVPQLDVASNRGSATVNLGGERYVFSHVAAFRSKGDIEGGDSTSIVFSKGPTPFGQMQRKLITDDYFSYIDVSSFDLPTYLVVEVGESTSISLSVPGTGLSRGLKNAIDGMQVEGGRIRGTLKLPTEEVFDDDVSFTATADAAIMTPYTSLGPDRSSVAAVEGVDFVDVAPSMPDDTEDFGRSGTNYSKTYTAIVRMSLGKTADFYRDTLTAQNWQAIEAASAKANEEVLRFRNSLGTMTVRLKSNGSRTDISITKHDDKRAGQDGIMPEAGKGRLILANAHNVQVVYTIGNTDYPTAPGAGADSFKDALNYSVAPGKYTVVIKIPGQRPKTETIQIETGSTWAVVAVPTGGYLLVQLY